MSSKQGFNLHDLSLMLAEKMDMSESDSLLFLNELFSLLTEQIFTEGEASVASLGTFKIDRVEPQDIKGVMEYYRLMFTLSDELSNSINKPFVNFETTKINEGVTFDNIPVIKSDEVGIIEDIDSDVSVLYVQKSVAPVVEELSEEVVAEEGIVVETPEEVVAEEETVVEIPQEVVAEEETAVETPEKVVAEEGTVVETPEEIIAEEEPVEEIPEEVIIDEEIIVETPKEVIIEQEAIEEAPEEDSSIIVANTEITDEFFAEEEPPYYSDDGVRPKHEIATNSRRRRNLIALTAAVGVVVIITASAFFFQQRTID